MRSHWASVERVKAEFVLVVVCIRGHVGCLQSSTMMPRIFAWYKLEFPLFLYLLRYFGIFRHTNSTITEQNKTHLHRYERKNRKKKKNTHLLQTDSILQLTTTPGKGDGGQNRFCLIVTLWTRSANNNKNNDNHLGILTLQQEWYLRKVTVKI